jgi:hypothetical protein
MRRRQYFYILRRTRPFEVKYDVVDSFLVCATSHLEARKAAAKLARDEGAETWLDGHYSICSQLDPNKQDPNVVILTDHRPR